MEYYFIYILSFLIFGCFFVYYSFYIVVFLMCLLSLHVKRCLVIEIFVLIIHIY